MGEVLETMEGIAPALQVRQSASFKHLTPHQYPCRMKGPGLSTAGPNPSDEHMCIHVSLSWEVGGEVLSVPERAVLRAKPHVVQEWEMGVPVGSWEQQGGRM